MAAEEATLKFFSPTTVIIAGASGSGKSVLLFQILRSAAAMFETPPDKIYYCYAVYQDLFDTIKNDLKNVEFVEGVPDKQDLIQWSSNKKHNLIVLDDLMRSVAKNDAMADLFCVYSHHMKFSVFLTVQNLYSGGKQFRTISLNAHAFILFKNGRDELQIRHLARQLLPGRTDYFMDAYLKATSPLFGYILIDISPRADPMYKLRSHILPSDTTVVYSPLK
ncbi:MAG: ATPase/DNA packaging protein [Sedimenticola sp.]